MDYASNMMKYALKMMMFVLKMMILRRPGAPGRRRCLRGVECGARVSTLYTRNPPRLTSYRKRPGACLILIECLCL